MVYNNMQKQRISNTVCAYIGEQNKPKEITFPGHMITQKTINKVNKITYFFIN